MAAKNSIKKYVDGGIYHLYNRGVNKSPIFLDDQDFSVFCSYLKDYLLPKDEISLNSILASPTSSSKEKDKATKLLKMKNFSSEIELAAYALLPNHFHFLIHQAASDTIDRFFNAFGARYSAYFNRKYKRVGPIFQGRYKAVLINSDEQLLHLSRYIHLNPFIKLNLSIKDRSQIPWPFSLPEYLGERKTAWVKPKLVLDYFRKDSPNNSYSSFMAENLDFETIEPAVIDFDQIQ